jgi:hypothetical protein
MGGKMLHDTPHISDTDLLLAADSELSSRRLAEVHAHLAECDACLERMDKLEATSADFASAYLNATKNEIADEIQARASLRHQLAKQREENTRVPWYAQLGATFAARQWAFNVVLALVLLAAVGYAFSQSWLTDSGGSIAQVHAAPLPRPNLTPGAAEGIPGEICLASPREDPSAIPVSERKEVFREYGMDYRRAGDYELDHLITPALGGTNDIHNLWPEPYATTEWNAHVKDQLEDLFHQKVCSGQMDLATAQREIATNWIDAYKRYFHTDRPLHPYSAYRRNEDDDFTPRS